MNKSETTDFGFQEVPLQDKQHLVANVFDSVATKYNLMNDLMSLGTHRLWKKITLTHLALKPGQVVLDLAGGTGDLTRQIVPKVGDCGQVILADVNKSMLNEAKKSLANQGIFKPVSYYQANAELLPFANDSFDCVVIAFGLRNVTNKDAALSEIYRILKPGAKLVILEFSKVQSEFISKIYDTYSFNIIPKLGKLIANDSASYQYLAESIRKHPDQQTLQDMLENCGYIQCSYTNLSFGICAIHKGFKA